MADTTTPFLTLKEAAQFARCHKRTLQRRIKDGKLKAHRLGRRLLIHQRDLECLLKLP
jgi:excisionase family DNA binding protein